jgi:hypothetical protein
MGVVYVECEFRLPYRTLGQRLDVRQLPLCVEERLLHQCSRLPQSNDMYYFAIFMTGGFQVPSRMALSGQ